MKATERTAQVTFTLLAMTFLAACSPQKPTAKDIEGLVLKETMAGFVSYSDVKINALNCAESGKKFNCVFTAHVKGKERSLIGNWSEFENDIKDGTIKVTQGDGGWMRVTF